MDSRVRVFAARGFFCVCSILVAVALPAAAQQAPRNEIKLAWDAVPGATGYRIDYGTASLDYGASADIGAAIQATVTVPVEAVAYYLAVKAYGSTGESMGWSREVVGWPRPELSAIDIQCNVPAGGAQECVATVTGFNFAPTITASIAYPGLTVTGVTRLGSRSLELAYDLAPTVQAGGADLVLRQAWTVTTGTQPPGDNGVTGGVAGPTLGGSITIGTVAILPAPQNLRFVNN